MNRTKRRCAVVSAYLAAALLFFNSPLRAESPTRTPAFRPPAVPLVTSDPYLSVWSMADRLTDDSTRHWTRREHPLVCLIRVDGETYRLMGKDPERGTPVLPQVGVRVFPTRSVYEFEGPHVHVTLTFMTPALPENLEILARRLTYLSWDVRSLDGRVHSVSPSRARRAEAGRAGRARRSLPADQRRAGG